MVNGGSFLSYQGDNFTDGERKKTRSFIPYSPSLPLSLSLPLALMHRYSLHTDFHALLAVGTHFAADIERQEGTVLRHAREITTKYKARKSK